MTSLYLEDLTPGRIFEGVAPTVVTEEEVVAFAARYDPQPFHMDAEAGRRSVFGGLAASGWHTAAMSMRMFVASLPIAGGLVGVEAAVKWALPTHPGDVLRVRLEVLEARPSASKPLQGLVRVRCLTLNQRDEVAQTMEATLVVPRRPEA
jgi:acyl dehydratase